MAGAAFCYALSGTLWFLIACVNTPELAISKYENRGQNDYVLLTGFCSTSLRSDSDSSDVAPCISGSDLAASQSDNAIRVALESFAWLWVLTVCLGVLNCLSFLFCGSMSFYKYPGDLLGKRWIRTFLASSNTGLTVTVLTLHWSVCAAQRGETGGVVAGGFIALFAAALLTGLACFVMFRFDKAATYAAAHPTRRMERKVKNHGKMGHAIHEGEEKMPGLKDQLEANKKLARR